MPANVAGRGEGTDTQMKMSGRAEGMGVRVSHGRGDHEQAQRGRRKGCEVAGTALKSLQMGHLEPICVVIYVLHSTTLAVSPVKGRDGLQQRSNFSGV